MKWPVFQETVSCGRAGDSGATRPAADSTASVRGSQTAPQGWDEALNGMGPEPLTPSSVQCVIPHYVRTEGQGEASPPFRDTAWTVSRCFWPEQGQVGAFSSGAFMPRGDPGGIPQAPGVSGPSSPSPVCVSPAHSGLSCLIVTARQAPGLP